MSWYNKKPDVRQRFKELRHPVFRLLKIFMGLLTAGSGDSREPAILPEGFPEQILYMSVHAAEFVGGPTFQRFIQLRVQPQEKAFFRSHCFP